MSALRFPDQAAPVHQVTTQHTDIRVLPAGFSRLEDLRLRFEELHERVARPVPTAVVKGSIFDDAATLVLHGDVSLETVPHLDSVVGSLIGLGLRRLVVDLSTATGASLGALAAIVRHEVEVDELIIRLPLVSAGASEGLGTISESPNGDYDCSEVSEFQGFVTTAVGQPG